jgi:hypothetical protein
MMDVLQSSNKLHEKGDVEPGLSVIYSTYKVFFKIYFAFPS